MTGNESLVQHKHIFKVLFFTRDDPETEGTIQKGDAIEHEGQIWLLPTWLISKDGAWSVPIRLVSLSALPMAAGFQKLDNTAEADYLLNYPIPIADFRNESPPETDHEFTMLERPSLKIARLN